MGIMGIVGHQWFHQSITGHHHPAVDSLSAEAPVAQINTVRKMQASNHPSFAC